MSVQHPVRKERIKMKVFEQTGNDDENEHMETGIELIKSPMLNRSTSGQASFSFQQTREVPIEEPVKLEGGFFKMKKSILELERMKI